MTGVGVGLMRRLNVVAETPTSQKFPPPPRPRQKNQSIFSLSSVYIGNAAQIASLPDFHLPLLICSFSENVFVYIVQPPLRNKRRSLLSCCLTAEFGDFARFLPLLSP